MDYRGSSAVARFSMDGGEGGGKRSSPKLFWLIQEGWESHPEHMAGEASIEPWWEQTASVWLCWVIFCTVPTSETERHNCTYTLPEVRVDLQSACCKVCFCWLQWKLRACCAGPGGISLLEFPGNNEHSASVSMGDDGTEPNASGYSGAPYWGQPCPGLWQQRDCTSLGVSRKESLRWKTRVLLAHCPVIYLQNDLRGTSEMRAEVINCF